MKDKKVTSTEAEAAGVPVTIIPELTREEEYPVQGAYLGFLITDFLNDSETINVTSVTYEKGCLFYSIEWFEQRQPGGEDEHLNLLVTFHRGTISLLCENEEWWSILRETELFSMLYIIADHTGCLVALSAFDSNAGLVSDPSLERELGDKYIHANPQTIN